MSWIDLLAAAIIVGISFAESHRGFGLALFDFIGALLITKIMLGVMLAIARVAPLGLSEAEAQGFWLITGFIVLIVGVIFISRAIHQTTLLSLDVMDPIVGAILGIASGIIVAHVLLRSMVLAWGETPFGEQLVETIAVRQLVEFRGYIYIFDALSRLGQTS